VADASAHCGLLLLSSHSLARIAPRSWSVARVVVVEQPVGGVEAVLWRWSPSPCPGPGDERLLGAEQREQHRFQLPHLAEEFCWRGVS
jgi:hypothetical protein